MHPEFLHDADITSENPRFPLLPFWSEVAKKRSRDSYASKSQEVYSQMLHNMTKDNVVWQPYKNVIGMPPDFNEETKHGMCTTVLIHFNEISAHRPDLCPKEFGLSGGFELLDDFPSLALAHHKHHKRSGGTREYDWNSAFDLPPFFEAWQKRSKWFIGPTSEAPLDSSAEDSEDNHGNAPTSFQTACTSQHSEAPGSIPTSFTPPSPLQSPIRPMGTLEPSPHPHVPNSSPDCSTEGAPSVVRSPIHSMGTPEPSALPYVPSPSPDCPTEKRQSSPSIKERLRRVSDIRTPFHFIGMKIPKLLRDIRKQRQKAEGQDTNGEK